MNDRFLSNEMGNKCVRKILFAITANGNQLQGEGSLGRTLNGWMDGRAGEATQAKGRPSSKEIFRCCRVLVGVGG